MASLNNMVTFVHAATQRTFEVPLDDVVKVSPPLAAMLEGPFVEGTEGSPLKVVVDQLGVDVEVVELFAWLLQYPRIGTIHSISGRYNADIFPEVSVMIDFHMASSLPAPCLCTHGCIQGCMSTARHRNTFCLIYAHRTSNKASTTKWVPLFAFA